MYSPETYTVGWICAIDPEYVAAQEFLDEEHGMPNFVQPRDDNSYVLGRIGEHNVVIASLPQGEYGTASAGRVAANMLTSFPNVRIGLMVGIGGGAPSKANDIRLGDIVVSSPCDGQGGVFQHDFGKAIQGQSFQHTRFLNQPPALLRSAVANVRTRYKRNGNQIQKAIDDVLNKNPRLQREFKRPDPSTDRLFEAEVIYDPMRVVSKSDLVERPERKSDEDNPAIHYGLIASGNQVVRDATVRDKYASDKNVLCFEMEAAGLMNDFPCLVIRGICDYSDSHKSNVWQGYAAMAAAAYAKDILKAIAPSRVEAETTLKEVMDLVKQDVEQMQMYLDAKQDEAIIDWLADNSYALQQSKLCDTRQEGTCRWLLDSDDFRRWQDAKGRTMFCSGAPGVGKTTMASFVASHLTSMASETNSCVAYIYVDYAQKERQGVADLLAALLRQLTCDNGALDNCVKDLYANKDKAPRPSRHDLLRCLESAIRKFDTAFFIVDALDECQSPECRMDLVSTLLVLQRRLEVNIFATSRPSPKVLELFNGCSNLVCKEVVASPEDVESFLDVQLPRLNQGMHITQEDLNVAKKTILKFADGRFLIVRRCVILLYEREVSHPEELRTALRQLQKTRESEGSQEMLDEVYKETMQRIRSQPDKLAIRALLWVACSAEQLRFADLQAALAIGPSEHCNSTSPGRLELDSRERILSVCLGLVTVDPITDCVRFDHRATYEYFTSKQEQHFPDGDAQITRTCISCLTTSAFPNTNCYSSMEKDKWNQAAPPLYMYAARNWGNYARKAPECVKETVAFLQRNEEVYRAGSALVASIELPHKSVEDSEMIGSNPGRSWAIGAFHLVAYFGILEAFHPLLRITRSQVPPFLRRVRLRKRLSQHTTFYRITPLHFAVLGGQKDLARLLVEYGAAVNAEDRYRWTPLALAGRTLQWDIEALLKREGGRAIVENGKEIAAKLANVYFASFPRISM